MDWKYTLRLPTSPETLVDFFSQTVRMAENYVPGLVDRLRKATPVTVDVAAVVTAADGSDTKEVPTGTIQIVSGFAEYEQAELTSGEAQELG